MRLILKSVWVLFSCSFLTLFSGCYDQNRSPNSSYLHFNSHARAMEQALSARVYCSSPNPSEECSTAVGSLVTLSLPASVGQCTAFLVTPQIAVTNRHCIPSDLRAAGSACMDRIWLYFPELPGFPQYRANCSRVLFASTESTVAHPDTIDLLLPDYAVIQLERPVHRTTLEISRDGFTDHMPYDLIKIDPTSPDSVIGVMSRRTCTAHHNSVFIPLSNLQQNPTMLMSDCEIIQGNSGAPFLDASGDVRGVIYASFNASELYARRSQRVLPVLESEEAPLYFATNFSCLPFPAGVSLPSLDPECAVFHAALTNGESLNLNSNRIDLISRIRDETQNRIQIEIEQLEVQLSPAFRWVLTPWAPDVNDPIRLVFPSLSPVDQFFIFLPTCIANESLLLGGDAGLTHLTKVLYRVGTNRYYVPEIRLDHLNADTIAVSYNSNELRRRHTTRFQISELTVDGRLGFVFDQVLGRCPSR